MRATMDEIDFAGRIVIGEGERDEAPMLYIGERVGRTGADRADVPAIDIAVDPLEGTNLVAHGQAGRDHRPRARPRRAASTTPPTRTSRSCASGRSRPARSTSGSARPRTSSRIAEALGRKVGDITVVILERPRHDAT